MQVTVNKIQKIIDATLSLEVIGVFFTIVFFGTLFCFFLRREKGPNFILAIVLFISALASFLFLFVGWLAFFGIKRAYKADMEAKFGIVSDPL